MIAFLEKLKEAHSDDASIQAFNEIENHIRDKKYGLVWEEHSEQVDNAIACSSSFSSCAAVAYDN